MYQFKLVIFPLLIFFLLCLFLFGGLEKRKIVSNRAELIEIVGQQFPSFSLKELNSNKTVNRKDLYFGQPYLVNIWATWCLSCHVEHPYLLELSQKQKIIIIGVNYRDNTSQAKQWLVDLGNPYKLTLIDQQGYLGIDLGVTGAPETLLISADNQILYKREGVLTADVWHEKIQPLYLQSLATTQQFKDVSSSSLNSTTN